MKKLFKIIPFLFVLIGASALAYPFVSNKLMEYNQLKMLNNYHQKATMLSKDRYSKEKKKVIYYDDNLTGIPLHDPFDEGAGYVTGKEYMDILNINQDGIMAFVEIPKINVNLPIYHTVTNQVLEKGAGHIPYTSTPYGGKNRHCFIAAHSGLPTALMFTNLDELKKGDAVFINVLNETHGYRVINREVVLPNKFVPTRATNGEDLITLVTCTPYGVNDHRLLVTCTRDDSLVKNKGLLEKNSINRLTKFELIYLILAIVAIIIVLVFIYLLIKNRKKTKNA